MRTAVLLRRDLPLFELNHALKPRSLNWPIMRDFFILEGVLRRVLLAPIRRECVFVCVRERESVCVRVCLCKREREREKGFGGGFF